jgi:hypothetical protein
VTAGAQRSRHRATAFERAPNLRPIRLIFGTRKLIAGHLGIAADDAVSGNEGHTAFCDLGQIFGQSLPIGIGGRPFDLTSDELGAHLEVTAHALFDGVAQLAGYVRAHDRQSDGNDAEREREQLAVNAESHDSLENTPDCRSRIAVSMAPSTTLSVLDVTDDDRRQIASIDSLPLARGEEASGAFEAGARSCTPSEKRFFGPISKMSQVCHKLAKDWSIDATHADPTLAFAHSGSRRPLSLHAGQSGERWQLGPVVQGKADHQGLGYDGHFGPALG